MNTYWPIKSTSDVMKPLLNQGRLQMKQLVRPTKWKSTASTLSNNVTNNSSSKNIRNDLKNPSMNNINISNVLIFNKITRYEFEKRRNPNLTDQQLKSVVSVLHNLLNWQANFFFN
jgi:hypothetical protein